jgi:hypothetical protein
VSTGEVALTNLGLFAAVGKLRDFAIEVFFSAVEADWGN